MYRYTAFDVSINLSYLYCQAGKTPHDVTAVPGDAAEEARPLAVARKKCWRNQRPGSGRSGRSLRESISLAKTSNNQGSSRVTIRDVAERAGVSVMTASNVLTGKGRMRDSTRDAVLEAMRALQYRPSNAARSLRSATDLRVALLYPDVESYFLTQLLLGALNGAAASGAHLVVEKYQTNSLECAVDKVHALVRSDCSALLLTSPLSERFAETVGDLSDVPIASIAGGADLAGMLSIRVDNVAAGARTGKQLLELGHRRVGFIGGPPAHSASRDRLDGFRGALLGDGLELGNDLVQPGNFDFPSGWTATEALLDLPHPPTAIFATSDEMAAAAVSCALRRGLQVPGELSVAGFDDTPFSARVWPAITTIRQPVIAMAEMAMKWLVERAREGKGRADECIVLPFELVERETTASPA